MKHYVLLFEECCFYEIIIACYFLKAVGEEVVYCSPDGGKVTCTEGFTVEAHMSLDLVDPSDVKSFIIPGGLVENAKSVTLTELLQVLHRENRVIGAICAGTGLLREAGVLDQITSVCMEYENCENCEAYGGRDREESCPDCVSHRNVITAAPNAYVDFAVEIGKALAIFQDEADLKETIDFWKFHKRV